MNTINEPIRLNKSRRDRKTRHRDARCGMARAFTRGQEYIVHTMVDINMRAPYDSKNILWERLENIGSANVTSGEANGCHAHGRNDGIRR